MPSTHNSWREVEKDIWEKTYESGSGDLLYIEDNLDGQTELGEEYWEEGRYTVRLRPGFAPESESALEKRYDAFDDLGEAEAYVEGLLTDL